MVGELARQDAPVGDWLAIDAEGYLAAMLGEARPEIRGTFRLGPETLPEVEFGQAKPRINPTNRELRFVVPLTDGPAYLGDVDLAVSPKDELSVAAPRFLQILAPLVTDAVFDRLSAVVGTAQRIDGALLFKEGIVLSYDGQNLALRLDISVAARRTRSFTLRDRHGIQRETLQPAQVSAYVNLRASADAVYQGPDAGLAAPLASLDGAMRIRGLVIEGEAYASARREEAPFRRAGTRAVYDDFRHDVRWIAGDFQPIVRSFQGAPALAGLSMSRIYSELEPQREIRSAGAQSFAVLAPSTIETIINGRPAERRRIQPGTYSIADFPLADGANDVRLIIEDDTGIRRVIDFTLFSDRSLLEEGLSEFAVSGGFVSRPTRGGIAYSRRFVTSAFWRGGLTPQITVGINAQADGKVQLAGAELLWGSPLGLIGLDLAGSRRDRGKEGFAVTGTYQLLRQSAGSFRSQSLRAAIEYRTKDFVIPSGYSLPPSSWSLQASIAYNNSFGQDRYVGAEARYARFGDGGSREYGVKGLFGFPLNEQVRVASEAEYRRRDWRGEFVARVGFVLRLGPRGQARAEASSRGEIQASYQNSGGQDVGAWSYSMDVNRTPQATTANLSGAYLTNRAELGLTHNAAFSARGSRAVAQRSSLRFGTAIAFADGALAVGRPITDSFLIAAPHASLEGRRLRLNPGPQSATAHSGALGAALAPDLSAYSNRVVTYDVPEAPAGYDLGQGNVTIRPPHRSGYRLVVGSDYHLLVFGRLLDRRGDPIALLAGKAIDLGNPQREAITVFTNRGGKFGAQGLRAGKWRIEMPTDPPTVFEIMVGEGTNDVVQLGDVRALDESGERK